MTTRERQRRLKIVEAIGRGYFGPTLRLYGGEAICERATRWARANNFQLVERTRCCRHVLLRRPCPSSTRYGECSHFPWPGFDHARVWQRPDGTRFLLAHEYADRATILDAARPLAHARGFVVEIDDSMDWYGHGTVPLRYDVAPEHCSTRASA